MAHRRRLVPVVLATCLAAAIVLAPTRAPADILEQRARLPPAAGCTDEIQGVWRSHQYYPNHGQWMRITVRVERVPGSARDLRGSVTTEYWYGDEHDVQPPACTPGEVHRSVTGTLAGFIEGTHLEWWVTDDGVEEAHCGGPMNNYERGRSSGTLDPGHEEFQSTLDTGESWREEPTLYRRIECIGEAGAAPGTPPPARPMNPIPAPPPPRGMFGCDCA
jgi:hypothetical protein